MPAAPRSFGGALYGRRLHALSFRPRALWGKGSDSGRRSCTLPGLSYSSNLITTDVPLILFWTVALYAWIMLVQRRSIGFAVFLGVAIGLGLLAKQAMVYAFLCIACQAAVSREAREALKGGRAVVLVSIAVALFAPNVVCNAQHGFPTVRHTETNIGWHCPTSIRCS